MLKHSAAGDMEVASAEAVAEQGAPELPGIDTHARRPLEGQRQGSSGSVQTSSGNGHAPDTRPGTKALRTSSPESDATAINTEPAKAPTLASPERLSGRVLVPASSPFVTKALVNAGKKVQTQDEIDDDEPAEESIDGHKESDPIELEPNEPSVDLASTHPNIDSILRRLRSPASHTTSNPSPDPEQPSRRSGRLASRRSPVPTSEATPALGRQPNRKASASPKKSPAKDHEQTQNEMAETSQEKPARKQIRKGHKVARLTAPNGSARVSNSSPGEWTTLPPLPETQTSTTDQPRTSSPGPIRPLLPLGDDVSLSADVGEATPMPIRRGVTPVASQGKGGGDQPLFFPGSSSQAPRIQIAPSPSTSESEAEMVAPALPRKTPTRSTPSGGTLRTLSGLASQDILFPKARAAKNAFNNTPSLKVKRPVLEADNDEDDEESSSSSDDMGDAPTTSHFPKERRAGVTPRRKGRRLSSLAKLGGVRN